MRQRARRGTGEVTRTANGKYLARISTTRDGRRVRTARTFETRAAALRWIADARPETGRVLTFAAWAAEWLSDCATRLAPRTTREYARHLKTLTPRLPGRLGSISPADVQRI